MSDKQFGWPSGQPKTGRAGPSAARPKLIPGLWFLPLACFLAVSVSMLTAGCGESLQDAGGIQDMDALDNNDYNNLSEKDVDALTEEKAYHEQSPPPLDQMVPSRLETATLALG